MTTPITPRIATDAKSALSAASADLKSDMEKAVSSEAAKQADVVAKSLVADAKVELKAVEPKVEAVAAKASDQIAATIDRIGQLAPVKAAEADVAKAATKVIGTKLSDRIRMYLAALRLWLHNHREEAIFGALAAIVVALILSVMAHNGGHRAVRHAAASPSHTAAPVPLTQTVTVSLLDHGRLVATIDGASISVLAHSSYIVIHMTDGRTLAWSGEYSISR